MLVKYCPNCNKILLATSEYFCKDKRSKDGFCYQCKNCHNELSRKYKEENREKIKRSAQEYRKGKKEVIYEKHKKYRENNKEKIIEYYRKFRKENNEKVKGYSQKWRENNKEKESERHRRYKKENPEIQLAINAKRRATKLNQTPILTQKDKQQIIDIYKKSHSLGENWHVDHTIPLSKGGLHHPDNLQIVAKKYNLEKGSKLNFRMPLNTEV